MRHPMRTAVVTLAALAGTAGTAAAQQQHEIRMEEDQKRGEYRF
ncbi:MAG TPA: hypothetical protein VFO95_13150 [Gemmatimonadales bacterium]|nr:hypothetical protein [Gemmatimonadales bacterium]